MLFGTWSQAHAYDPSDYMETRLHCSFADQLQNTDALLIIQQSWQVLDGQSL